MLASAEAEILNVCVLTSSFVDHAIAKIKERNRDGYSIDFQVGQKTSERCIRRTHILVQDLIARFTLDSATEFLFGACVHSLETTLPYPWNAPPHLKVRSSSPAEAFARAFAEAQDIISTRTRIGPIWPFYELLKDKSAEPMRVVDEYLVPILETAVEKHKEAKKAGLEQRPEEISDNETLLDHLVKYTDGTFVFCRLMTLTYVQCL